jgi:hypothetical protein
VKYKEKAMTKKSILIATVVLLTLAMTTLWGQGAVEYMEANPDLASEAQAEGPVVVSETTPDLTDEEGILLMREEEKLARDVYLALYEQWGIRTFANIARSEQRHMDTVAALMATKGISDPVIGSAPGEFVNKELQSLYDDLVAKGSASAVEALTVGAIIEDLDIYDLKRLLEKSDDPLTMHVYTSLLRGSENHMRSFAGMLERVGQSYEAQYITVGELDAILGK